MAESKNTWNVGWVNFSAGDVQRMKDVLHSVLDAPGSVDELGIAIIRDYYADCFFPGINAMQTSMKYFLLIPKMLQKIEMDCMNKIRS